MGIKKNDLGLINVTVDADSVYMTITIGNYQIGGSDVHFVDTTTGATTPLAKGDISHLLIGNKADIIGKTLEVVTTVLDSNSSSNNIIVVNGLDGTNFTPTTTTDTVDNNGDYYALRSKYFFN